MGWTGTHRFFVLDFSARSLSFLANIASAVPAIAAGFFGLWYDDEDGSVSLLHQGYQEVRRTQT